MTGTVDAMTSTDQRAALHAALGEPTRLALVDELARSDRSPTELAAMFDLAPNRLAHHLDVLEDVGLLERFISHGDKRRRYVRLVQEPLEHLGIAAGAPRRPVVFICSRNSARSQLAAALWRQRTNGSARSAGTDPADRVHPGAVAAARRAGLDISGATPQSVGRIERDELVVTVCDQAHEELRPSADWLHWSLADPVEAATDAAFDRTIEDLDLRIRTTWN